MRTNYKDKLVEKDSDVTKALHHLENKNYAVTTYIEFYHCISLFCKVVPLNLTQPVKE